MGGPLHGVRVVELAGIGPAPLAAHLLADLGADVLRVHRPGAPPEGADGLGAGRPALTADLKQPADMELVRAAVNAADVLLEGFRPGTTERLGLGPDQCLARNPGLVYTRVSGWGQSGPLAQSAGHDINYLAVTGALHAIGPAGGSPVPPLNLLADFAGGSMFAVAGVLAALVERARTGAGQVVDAAMVDGVSLLMTLVWTMRGQQRWRDERGTNLLDGGAPFYTTYRCADGRHVAVGALEPAFYEALLTGLRAAGAAIDDLPDRADEARWPELRAGIGAAFAARPRDDWVARFAGTDACVTPVRSLGEAPHDPQLTARGTLRQDGPRVRPGPAPRFSGHEPAAQPEPVETATELLARWGVRPAAPVAHWQHEPST